MKLIHGLFKYFDGKLSKVRMEQLLFKGEQTKLSGLYNELRSLWEEDPSALNHLDQHISTPARKKQIDRLETRMQNLMLFSFSEKSNMTFHRKMMISMSKKVLVTKILLSNGFQKESILVAERTIKEAMRFHCINQVVELADILRKSYGIYLLNKTKFKKYQTLSKAYSRKTMAIWKVKEMLDEINVLTLSFKDRSQLLDQYTDCIITLREIPFDDYSYFFAYYFKNLEFDWCQLNNDLEGMQHVCVQALEYFDQLDFDTHQASWAFSLRLLACSIIQKDYAEGERLSKACISLANSPFNALRAFQFNNFVTFQFSLILFFHAKQYQKAYQCFQQMVQKRFLKSMPTFGLEYMTILEGYLYILQQVGEVPMEMGKSRTFRLQKFLNSVPVHSKDKSGTKVQVLIVQILILLHRKEYGVIIDKMEALSMYCQRYLKKSQTYRLNCFMNLLLLLPKRQFNRIAIKRDANAWLKRLNSRPLTQAGNELDFEPIPFEDLWGITLNILDDKFHVIRSSNS